jgi:hypothetical protein
MIHSVPANKMNPEQAMNSTSVVSKNSIVQHVLLGTTASTLRSGIWALKVQAVMFSRIEPLAAAGDDVAALARLGCRALSDALTECREHADSGDILGVVDCLSRVVSSHRLAKNLLSAIVELGDTNVAELAQLGVNLAISVLDDLGA